MSLSAPEQRELTAEQSAWGGDSISLCLPGVAIQLYGLSTGQRDTLADSYRGFVGVRSAGGVVLRCRAYRLSASHNVSREALSRDGQYTLIKRPNAGSSGLELTGVNFVAGIEFDPQGRPSSIGTETEQALTQPIVIENFLRVVCAYHALQYRGVMLHSAGFVVDGKAYIFCGRSNAGKTTLTRKAHAAGALILSDDINLILPQRDCYRAHAVPFTGEFGRTLDQPGEHQNYPVAGLVLLRQGDCLAVEPVKPVDAVAALMAGCPFVNDDEQVSAALFDALLQVVEEFPVLRLDSRREDSIEAILSALEVGIGEEVTA